MVPVKEQVPNASTERWQRHCYKRKRTCQFVLLTRSRYGHDKVENTNGNKKNLMWSK